MTQTAQKPNYDAITGKVIVHVQKPAGSGRTKMAFEFDNAITAVMEELIKGSHTEMNGGISAVLELERPKKAVKISFRPKYKKPLFHRQGAGWKVDFTSPRIGEAGRRPFMNDFERTPEKGHLVARFKMVPQAGKDFAPFSLLVEWPDDSDPVQTRIAAIEACQSSIELLEANLDKQRAILLFLTKMGPI